MPSVTEYLGYGVTNFGPLTTTFTAAPSCATANQLVYYGNASNLAQYWGEPSCTKGLWGNECYPSGEKLDSLISALYATPTQGIVNYYSPGIACPAGWTTAGTVAHVTPTPAAGGDESAFNRSGVFTEDPWGIYRGFDEVTAKIPQGEVYLEVLGPSETLALCCPSGYEANIHGGCSSSLGPLTSYSYTGLCFVEYPSEDYVTVSTYTEPSLTVNVVSITDVAGDIITSSTALSDALGSGLRRQLVLATRVPAVALVYQESDLSNSGDSPSLSSSSPSPSTLLTLLLPMWVLIGVVTGAGLIMH